MGVKATPCCGFHIVLHDQMMNAQVKSRLASIAVSGALMFSASAASAAAVFFDDFSSNTGWTLDTPWQIGSTSISPFNGYNQDPELDHTATADNGVLGARLGGDIGGPDGLHGFYYATSPTYNLSSMTGVELSFWRWLNSDYDPFMTSQVEVFDGAAWQVIYTNCCIDDLGYVDDNSWTLQSFNVSAYANNNANFAVRFSYDVTSANALAISGWNVDDLTVSSSQVPEPGSLALVGLGLLALARRSPLIPAPRRSKQKKARSRLPAFLLLRPAGRSRLDEVGGANAAAPVSQGDQKLWRTPNARELKSPP